VTGNHLHLVEPYRRPGLNSLPVHVADGFDIVRETDLIPAIVPFGADQTVYLVTDRSGASASDLRQVEVERTDLESVIVDLISGRFNNPIRVVAFNTLEHWKEDISFEVALEIQLRFDIEGDCVPAYVEDFVSSQLDCGRSSHLSAPLPAAAPVANEACSK
jgi:hypothetical protein